ncbi:hypothetical protein [Synechococcus sp. PCC 7336]|uniref:hypothetical protein n=1 Tax=Synechococcus sp. PCC 7336 TaxID=195250 RepID=UPI0003629585|nr:hypothetical protein [Synechococcus sp. PCC 7336]
MSRYSHAITLPNDQEIRSKLKDLLSEQGFNVIYESADYIVAREEAGKVSFSRLVTAELFLNRSTADRDYWSCIVKNEELPLQTINHCQQLFEKLRVALEAFAGSMVA